MAPDVLLHAELPFPTSLPQFQRLFPDDTACAHYLEQIRWGVGFTCAYCRERHQARHAHRRIPQPLRDLGSASGYGCLALVRDQVQMTHATVLISVAVVFSLLAALAWALSMWIEVQERGDGDDGG